MRRFIAVASVLLALGGCQSGPEMSPEERAAFEREAARLKRPGHVILGATRGFGPAPEFVFHRFDPNNRTIVGKPLTATPFADKPRFETADGLAFSILPMPAGEYVLSSVTYRIDAYPVRNVNIHCMDQGAHRFTVEPDAVLYLGNFATDARTRTFVHSPGNPGHIRNLLRNFPEVRGEPVSVGPELVDFVHAVDCAGVVKGG